LKEEEIPSTQFQCKEEKMPEMEYQLKDHIIDDYDPQIKDLLLSSHINPNKNDNFGDMMMEDEIPRKRNGLADSVMDDWVLMEQNGDPSIRPNINSKEEPEDAESRKEGNISSFLDLPDAFWLLIFRFLSTLELLQVYQSCKKLQFLVSSDLELRNKIQSVQLANKVKKLERKLLQLEERVRVSRTILIIYNTHYYYHKIPCLLCKYQNSMYKSDPLDLYTEEMRYLMNLSNQFNKENQHDDHDDEEDNFEQQNGKEEIVEDSDFHDKNKEIQSIPHVPSIERKKKDLNNEWKFTEALIDVLIPLLILAICIALKRYFTSEA
jgi:hypothetical protein